MLQKFGKKVMNNFGLKILAVLFAVVLWIVVVNIDDPSNSKPYTTSVSLENKSYITSMGKWADYLDGKNSLEEAVTILKRDTRHFAKRQLTWFRRERDVNWIQKEEFGYDEEKILQAMLVILKEKEITD